VHMTVSRMVIYTRVRRLARVAAKCFFIERVEQLERAPRSGSHSSSKERRGDAEPG
jgi:hypothetical protein